MYSSVALFVALLSLTRAYDTQLAFDGDYSSIVEVENRTLDEIYEAAVAEGGVVTLWHGGDEKNQQDALKKAFETRFPKMTLNVTVDLSKYHDGKIDQQLATGGLYVDSAFLQSLHDYPRWDEEGALLHYKPLGFDAVYDAFREDNGAYYGISTFAWSNIWNTKRIGKDDAPKEYTDYLKPVFKDKLVLTYPNDDDAVLYAFDLIMQQYGLEWFDALLKQNPRWVRGTGTPATLIGSSNDTHDYAATFTASVGLSPSTPYNISFPQEGRFVSWDQTGAIFKDAPHKEGAKLLHSFVLSKDYQEATGTWSVRRDVASPAGFPDIMDMPGTDATKFKDFMLDRARIERLRFWFEDRLGTAQGLSPLIDDL